MKIYTRTGDDGTTGLIGGRRASKNEPRIDCYGTIDETNAHIGLATVVAPPVLVPLLQQVQHELFVLGSHMAAADPGKGTACLPPLTDEMALRLEQEIDAAEARLPQLRNFILPGGTECAARLHVARTVCRRAERLIVEFAQTQPISAGIISYLNRLSDWMFVHARLANQLAGVEDIPWNG